MSRRDRMIDATCAFCRTSFRTRACAPNGCCSRTCAAKKRARLKGGMAVRPDLFWAKVRIGAPDECWLWMGAKNKWGYGRLHQPGSKTDILAHRLALKLSGRAVPSDLNVLHSCDNPPCCNPHHLRVGTQKENGQDRALRKPWSWRMTTGEHNGRCKLTPDQVIEIRRQVAAGIPQPEIAELFGVSRESVNAIHLRVNWRHL
jgi:hypothetical protein